MATFSPRRPGLHAAPRRGAKSARALVKLAAAAAAAALAAGSAAFLAAPRPPTTTGAGRLVAEAPKTAPPGPGDFRSSAEDAAGRQTSASASGAGAAIGAWAAAAALASLGARGSSSRAALRATAEGEAKAATTATEGAKEAEKTEKAAEEEEKEPFDVWKPDTYGNITMDDVKKYGAAGTLAYVITELLFWALAVPTECAIFYNINQRWPDFNNDLDKAAVLGFVFAASNVARLCLPLRFGAALAMAPWVDKNIMSKMPGSKSETTQS